jgi:hypothetical protein
LVLVSVWVSAWVSVWVWVLVSVPETMTMCKDFLHTPQQSTNLQSNYSTRTPIVLPNLSQTM